jgi:hypothetical protein
MKIPLNTLTVSLDDCCKTVDSDLYLGDSSSAEFLFPFRGRGAIS